MSKRNKGAYLKWIAARQAWYIVWFEQGRLRKKSTGTRNRIEADQALSQHNIEKDQPVDIVSPTRRIIADVLAAYAEEHLVHTASKEAGGNNIKSLIPFWGHRPVSDVRPVLCRQYVQYRRESARKAGKNASDGLIARELGVLGSATLTWSQVDLDRGIIDLNKASGKITNKRRAIVPIPSKLMTFLRIAKRRAQENCADENVIEYFGKPILRIDQGFRRVARDADLKDVTPHTLRHTAATWMAQAGVPMWVISKYLGHTSTRTTERIYAHHNPSFLMEAKRALERRSKHESEANFKLNTKPLTLG